MSEKHVSSPTWFQDSLLAAEGDKPLDPSVSTFENNLNKAIDHFDKSLKIQSLRSFVQNSNSENEKPRPQGHHRRYYSPYLDPSQPGVLMSKHNNLIKQAKTLPPSPQFSSHHDLAQQYATAAPKSSKKLMRRESLFRTQVEQLSRKLEVEKWRRKGAQNDLK